MSAGRTCARSLWPGWGSPRARGWRRAGGWRCARGVSKAGNDHVHVVVGLVREDGTKASTWNDRPGAQKAAGGLERKHALVVLESRQAGRGSRGHRPGERELAQRHSGGELPRERLEAHGAGVRGGRLARDLTLPRLRSAWPDSPKHAGDGVSEWTAAGRNQGPVAPGAEVTDPDPALWERYTAEIAELRERLRSVPVKDRATWAHVARETAGALAAWSLRVEPAPGPLAATAQALARSAQLRAYETRGKTVPGPSARGAAMLLIAAGHGGRGPVAEAVMLRQLANLAKAVHDMHVAAGEGRRAVEIETVVRGQLATVSGGLAQPPSGGVDLEALDAAPAASQGQLPPRSSGPPIPGALPARAPSQRPRGVDLGRTDIER
jgi:hypothetical protein